MVSRGFPAIFLAYICKLMLYYFKEANNKNKISKARMSKYRNLNINSKEQNY